MPRVTTLRATGGGRFVVHLDGMRLGTVSETVVARHGLHTQCELSEAEARALKADAVLDSALADAHRLLARRSRARREIEHRLAIKGHPDDAVSAVVERLLSDGLLDDQAFAAAFVADKRRLAGWGRQRIVAELRRLGVAASIIQEVLGPPEADAGEEAARAAALLVRMGDPTPPLEATRRRALDRLRRRGFSNAVAYRAVQDWLAAAATQYDHDNGDRAGDS